MVIYQNIFTRIQVRPPTPYPGVKLPPDDVARDGKPRFMHLFGRLGRPSLRPGRVPERAAPRRRPG
jgi:hypothetical protein